MIKLAAAQKSAGKYLIYSYPIKIDVEVLLKQPINGARMFWQSADRSLTLLGMAPLKQLVGKSFAQIKTFQDSLRANWTNLTPTVASQPILLGGFPFDDCGKRAPFWGTLEKGYFILPQILFWQNKEQSYVTLLVNSIGDPEEKLNQLANQVTAILQAQPLISQPLPSVVTQEMAVSQWLQLVTDSVSAIKDDKLKKVVLARQLALSTTGKFDPIVIVERLMKQQPNTYHFLLDNGTQSFIGATPERLLKATRTTFQTASVAGSIGRGKTPEVDYQLGQELLNDHKNEYEHQVVLKRITTIMNEFTNDLVVGPRQLLKNRDIQHIYHPFTGQRKAGAKLLSVLKALHPTPALGGEPRASAMKWLAKKEPAGRGLYGGPIGWLGLGNDQGEFAVGLRSGIFHQNKGLLYAGCGIVAESQAEKERQETGLKFQPMLRGVNDKWTIKKH